MCLHSVLSMYVVLASVAVYGQDLDYVFGPLIPEAEALKTEALIVSSVIEISVCLSVCSPARGQSF